MCAEGKVSTVGPSFWPSGTSGDGPAPAAPAQGTGGGSLGFVCWFYCEAEVGLRRGTALCGARWKEWIQLGWAGPGVETAATQGKKS